MQRMTKAAVGQTRRHEWGRLRAQSIKNDKATAAAIHNGAMRGKKLRNGRNDLPMNDAISSTAKQIQPRVTPRVSFRHNIKMIPANPRNSNGMPSSDMEMAWRK